MTLNNIQGMIRHKTQSTKLLFILFIYLSFSIATTPRCRRGATLFRGLLHFTLDAYLTLLNVKQGGIKYHF